MPVAFFGHGNPLNALEENDYTRGWREMGRAAGRPRAILAISAHWYLPDLAVTAQAAPPTIHDFGGFPRALYDVQYPAPGSPALAVRVAELLGPLSVTQSHDWGLDHGTWAVLRHAFPQADIPVVQLSIDETQPPEFHYDLGRRLRPLRDEGILIAASGNLIHNLHAYAWGRHPAAPFDWAVRFETEARALLLERRFDPLIGYEAMGRDAQLSAPTPDHYLPLLYACGATDDRDGTSFPVEGIDGGSVSMLSVLFTSTS